MRFSLLMLLLVLSPLSSAETFYKWQDESGVTHYSANPPAERKADTIAIKRHAPDAPPIATPDELETSAVQKNVTIYSAQWCGVCRRAKSYFRQQGIQYTEYDVENSAQGRADFQRLGGRGVPIIFVGNERMDGFSEAHFERMMGNL